MSEILVNMPVGLAYAANPRFEIPNHIELINSKLMDIANGKLNRLIISMPPRHGKSELTTKTFAAWYLLNNPEKNVIVVGHGTNFAVDRFGRPVRNLVKTYSKAYNTSIARDSNATNRFTLKEGGSFKAIGKGGDITGRGADLLIVDDPIKNNEEAYSQRQREKLWEWFITTPMTRLEPGAAIIIIMTRWHNDDIVGRILSSESAEEWEYLCIPAISDNNEALWPERYNINKLESIKKQIGTLTFNALYMQKPVTNENQIFVPDWWQRYKELPPLNAIIQSWDMAVKDGQSNDYYVCTTWGADDTNDYLIDLWRKKVKFPAALQAVKDLADKYNPTEILIEDKSNGSPIIQTLKDSTRLPIKPIEPKGSKEARAHAVTARIENGNVFIPEKAPWLDIFILETAEFPFSAHDDIVDTVTQALNRLKAYKGSVKVASKPTNNSSVFSKFNTRNL